MKLNIKKGDTVKVMAGDEKGKVAKIAKIFPKENKAIVEGLNMVSRHTKPSTASPQGGIVKKEAPINISNLSLINSKGEASRVGKKIENGKTVRFLKKGNEIVK